MRFYDMGPGDIVAYVFSHFEPAPLWDADRISDDLVTTETPRLYCPGCLRHGTVAKGQDYTPPKRNPENRDKAPRDQAHWYCENCKGWFKRPSALTRRGTIGGKQTGGGRDKDWRIVDGIQAGKVMAAVDGLRPMPRAWAIWVHTEQGTSQMRARLVRHLVHQLDGAISPKRWIEGHGATLFANLVLDDERERARNGRRRYTNTELARSAGIPRQELYDDGRWARIRAVYERACDTLEQTMARAVIQAISKPVSETA